ncbi:hypothetical protein QBC43DRAFT_334128 [Cladorrhinum sp. PSN259]|nr:hypothetical protein QBC43DRAFT_334128 [Cladorrhinum sp. PSN259]
MSDTEEIPIPDIPIHVYVIIAFVVLSLLLSQMLGFWLTGFKRPKPVEDGDDPVYNPQAKTGKSKRRGELQVPRYEGINISTYNTAAQGTASFMTLGMSHGDYCFVYNEGCLRPSTAPMYLPVLSFPQKRDVEADAAIDGRLVEMTIVEIFFTVLGTLIVGLAVGAAAVYFFLRKHPVKAKDDYSVKAQIGGRMRDPQVIEQAKGPPGLNVNERIEQYRRQKVMNSASGYAASASQHNHHDPEGDSPGLPYVVGSITENNDFNNFTSMDTIKGLQMESIETSPPCGATTVPEKNSAEFSVRLNNNHAPSYFDTATHRNSFEIVTPVEASERYSFEIPSPVEPASHTINIPQLGLFDAATNRDSTRLTTTEIPHSYADPSSERNSTEATREPIDPATAAMGTELIRQESPTVPGRISHGESTVLFSYGAVWFLVAETFNHIFRHLTN